MMPLYFMKFCNTYLVEYISQSVIYSSINMLDHLVSLECCSCMSADVDADLEWRFVGVGTQPTLHFDNSSH